MKQKRQLKIFLIFLLLALIPVTYIYLKKPDYFPKISRAQRPTAKEKKTKGKRTKSSSKPLRGNDPIVLHKAAAKSFNLNVLKSDKDIEAAKKSGKLVPVKNSTGLKINRLSYSKGLLLPEANEVLKEIGQKFSEKSGKGNFFVVNSLTRTLEDQKRLRKTNANASKEISTHNYGCSFDISYIRFNHKKGPNLKLERQLEEVLAEMRKQKKIYVIKEKNMKCYHITARNTN